MGDNVAWQIILGGACLTNGYMITPVSADVRARLTSKAAELGVPLS